MNSVPDITKQILLSDEASLESLRKGVLNLRAYASTIHKQVESLTKKKVNIGTIVIALSRISKNINDMGSLKPNVRIENLGIKADLSVITFEKTASILDKLSRINSIQRRDKDFFVIAEGIAEITIVGSNQNINKIELDLISRAKSKFKDAVAITIRFEEKYIKIPNVLHTFTSSLALKRINLILIVSTLTEVSFIVDKKDMNETVDTFKEFLS